MNMNEVTDNELFNENPNKMSSAEDASDEVEDAGEAGEGEDAGEAGEAGEVEDEVDAGESEDESEVDANEVDANEVDANEVDAHEVDANEVDLDKVKDDNTEESESEFEDLDEDEDTYLNKLIGGAGASPKTKTTNKKKPIAKEETESSSDSSSDEDDDYLQKFDQKMRDDLILNFHPESKSHNYEEIKQLAKVTRNKNGVIVDELHKTIPILTKYEKTRILGQRAKQIECGAVTLVQVPPNIIDSYLIAKLELEQQKIPFIIRRPLPNGGMEYWYVSDLENL
jgi:DNA-directed RNA polymerase subunit K/omega